MPVKPTSAQELRQIMAETFFNKTSKVTKISDESVLSGIFWGSAKVGQKALKDIALAASHLYPESATGKDLDLIAEKMRGIAPRFSALGSSVFVRLIGAVGTEYLSGVHKVTGANGVVFNFTDDVTIPIQGFCYAKLNSNDAGAKTNVEALSLSKVTPVPVGHKFVVNEYRAVGGRDNEQDDLFRLRIEDSINLYAKGTLALLEQAFMLVNNNVLRVFYQGSNDRGQTRLAIATQNGADLTSSELDEILERCGHLLNLTDERPFGGQFYGVELVNVEYFPVDVSFRCDILNNYDPDDVRKQIQIQMSKYLDFRFWDDSRKIEWVKLIGIVNSVQGIKSCPDTEFTPNIDIEVPLQAIPRIRGFLMLNLDGNIIGNTTGTLNPVYYPNQPDFRYQQTLLSDI